MPALSAPSATVSSTSPAPCSKTARCSTPASRAKNALDKRWEVQSRTGRFLNLAQITTSAGEQRHHQVDANLAWRPGGTQSGAPPVGLVSFVITLFRLNEPAFGAAGIPESFAAIGPRSPPPVR